MSRRLPFPLFTASLFILWLLLVGSIGPGSVLLGLLLAFLGTRLLLVLGVPRARLRRPRVALELAWVVLVEVIRSNNAVARIILGLGTRNRTSGFVSVPLDMRDPYGLSVLACIITATPGTIWVEYDSTQRAVLLHVLDLVGEQEEWVRIIKNRYERRLMEIFE